MGGTQAETRAAGGQGTDSKEKTTPVLAAVWRGASRSTCWQHLATSLGGSGHRTPARLPDPAPARGRILGSQVKCVTEAEDAAGRSPEWGLISRERRAQAPRAECGCALVRKLCRETHWGTGRAWETAGRQGDSESQMETLTVPCRFRSLQIPEKHIHL